MYFDLNRYFDLKGFVYILTVYNLYNGYFEVCKISDIYVFLFEVVLEVILYTDCHRFQINQESSEATVQKAQK